MEGRDEKTRRIAPEKVQQAISTNYSSRKEERSHATMYLEWDSRE